MINLTPTGNNLYLAQCDFDIIELLKKTDDLMENDEIEEACQMRYDVMVEFSEELDKLEDEIELDMNNKENLALVDLLVKCGIDHYFISDFEIAAAVFETVIEIDPEDNFGASTIVGYCYAGLGEWESLDEILETGCVRKIEEEFLTNFALISQAKPAKPSAELIESLKSEESEIAYFSEPLRTSFPKIFESFQ